MCLCEGLGMHEQRAHRIQKKASDAPELVLHTVESQPMWILGIKMCPL